MIAWPANVNYRPLRAGYEEKPLFTPETTDMQDGPPRMRSSGDIIAIASPVMIVLRSPAEVRTLRDFLVHDLNRASAPFMMPVRLLGEEGYAMRVCEIQKGEYAIAPFGRIDRVSFTRVVYL
jgi:hypothetical protein